jgi:hypothetical protein
MGGPRVVGVIVFSVRRTDERIRQKSVIRVAVFMRNDRFTGGDIPYILIESKMTSSTTKMIVATMMEGMNMDIIVSLKKVR